jgi:hypothetical protein
MPSFHYERVLINIIGDLNAKRSQKKEEAAHLGSLFQNLKIITMIT